MTSQHLWLLDQYICVRLWYYAFYWDAGRIWHWTRDWHGCMYTYKPQRILRAERVLVCLRVDVAECACQSIGPATCTSKVTTDRVYECRHTPHASACYNIMTWLPLSHQLLSSSLMYPKEGTQLEPGALVQAVNWGPTNGGPGTAPAGTSVNCQTAVAFCWQSGAGTVRVEMLNGWKAVTLNDTLLLIPLTQPGDCCTMAVSLTPKFCHTPVVAGLSQVMIRLLLAGPAGTKRCTQHSETHEEQPVKLGFPQEVQHGASKVSEETHTSITCVGYAVPAHCLCHGTLSTTALNGTQHQPSTAPQLVTACNLVS